MGDIITTFSKIGLHYLEDEKRVKNKSYEYDMIRVYLYDIEDKSIDVSLNIPKNELIISRFGVGANSGNLFPNIFFDPKEVKKNYDKFVKAILKSNKNLLSYFTKEEIEKNNILKIISTIDNSFFIDDREDIEVLEKYPTQKGQKTATYFSLSYKGKPISAYFEDIFEKHLQKTNSKTIRGYDIIDNQEGIGGDANLAFCSVNELPKKFQSIKARLLPLSYENAKRVKVGFDVVDKMLSHNFYGLKLAIMPMLISEDSISYKQVLQILEEVKKGDITEIEDSETYINEFLEGVATKERDFPILNTILFYKKSNAAVDVLLQIDDVLPSYISYLSQRLEKYHIKAFREKDSKDTQNIYMQNIFNDRLEIMNILLSSVKIDKDMLIEKFSELIYWGNINKKYAHIIDWSKYFNGYYEQRSINAINRYLMFFNDTKKLKENFILQKECVVDEIKEPRAKIKTLIKNSPFLDNEVLKAAYLLGMLSAALTNWQFGISNGSSYNKWLNNSGTIGKDSLDRIWKKAVETIRKLNSTTGKGNSMVNEIKELVIESLPQALLYDGIVKSSYVSLAFAMGGSDFTNKIKEEKK